MKLRTWLLAGLALIATAILAVQAQVPGVNSTLNEVFNLVYDASTMKPTYSATMTFAPNTAAGTSTTTDVCTLTGSATATIKIRRILFSMQATTAVTDPIAIIKRSTANTGGTSWVVTPTSYDSTNQLTNSTTNTATATAAVYTTNPTVGTAVGVIADPLFSIGNLTTGGAQTFGSQLRWGELGSPIVLRGVLQSVAINFNSYQYSGNIANCTFEWTEE